MAVVLVSLAFSTVFNDEVPPSVLNWGGGL